jgi:transposase-like protein
VLTHSILTPTHPAQPCPHCKTTAAVVPVHLARVDPEVQYFSCRTCGTVFGRSFSEDGRALQHWLSPAQTGGRHESAVRR